VERLIKNRPVCALMGMLAAVYVFYLTADLFFAGLRPFSAIAKYLGVLLCLALALLLSRGARNKLDAELLVFALFLTCAADLFLLLLDRPVPGLIVFCAVHLTYIRRYRPAVFRPAAAVTFLLLAGCLAGELLIPGFPIKYALSCVYGAFIVTAAVCGCASALPRTNRRLVNAGMALFLLCDIHVALFNALPASHPYYPFAAFLMWLFYLPAQVCLALSGYDYAE